jgi:hypothetical protein
LIPKEKLGLASGIQALGYAFGTLGGSLFIAIIMQFVPGVLKYFLAYGLASAGFLLASCYTVFGLREEHKEPEVRENENVRWRLWITRSIFKTFYFPCDVYYRFYIVSFCTLLMYIGFNLIGPFLQYFVKDILQFKEAILITSVVIMIFVLSSAFGSLVGGFFSDKKGPKIVVFVGLCLLVAGFGIYLFVVALIYNSLLACIILFFAFVLVGLGFGSSLAALNVITLKIIPQDKVARDLAIVNQFMLIGSILGTLIGGQILAWIKSISIRLAYCVLISTCLGCFILVFIFMFFVKIDLDQPQMYTNEDEFSQLREEEEAIISEI